MKRHYGRITTTGRDIVVVFRQLMDDLGNVTDPEHCLFVDVTTLDHPFNHEVGELVESQLAQANMNLYEILYNHETLEGENMLLKLHGTGKLEKERTRNIQMNPDTPHAILLSTLNEQLNYVMQPPAQAAQTEQEIADSQEIATATARDPNEEARFLMEEAAYNRSLAEQKVLQAEQLSPGITARLEAERQGVADAAVAAVTGKPKAANLKAAGTTTGKAKTPATRKAKPAGTTATKGAAKAAPKRRTAPARRAPPKAK